MTMMTVQKLRNEAIPVDAQFESTTRDLLRIVQGLEYNPSDPKLQKDFCGKLIEGKVILQSFDRAFVARYRGGKGAEAFLEIANHGLGLLDPQRDAGILASITHHIKEISEFQEKRSTPPPPAKVITVPLWGTLEVTFKRRAG